jgi:hypothetical protein
MRLGALDVGGQEAFATPQDCLNGGEMACLFSPNEAIGDRGDGCAAWRCAIRETSGQESQYQEEGVQEG